MASRRAFEKGRFDVLKKEKAGLSDGEGGVSFYIVSPDWFQTWKEFIQGQNFLPRVIDNSVLKFLIKD